MKRNNVYSYFTEQTQYIMQFWLRRLAYALR